MVVAVVNMGVLGPLVHGRAEVAVVRQPAGDDQFATARSSGYRGGAGVALQRVRRVKLLDVVTDFAGDAGGEAIPEAGEAEVDFIARDRFSEPADNSQQGSVPAVWGSVLVLALLAAVDPVRLGLTLLLISRPRPVQNLLAYGVGSPDSVYSHIGGSADAAARHTNV